MKKREIRQVCQPELRRFAKVFGKAVPGMSPQAKQTTIRTSQSVWREYRFGLLLAALLVMLVHEPITQIFAPRLPLVLTRILLGFIFGWLMISAVYAVSERRRAHWLALSLGLPALLLELVDLTLMNPTTQLLGHMLVVVFLSYIIYVLLRFIFSQSRIGPNIVFAALCVYLLLGVLWAFFYSLLEIGEPGSFNSTAALEQQMRFGSDGTSLALYYSFVTMTSLGYGDIVPISSAARSLAILQVICGQFFLTVVIAWLVGLSIAHSRKGDP